MGIDIISFAYAASIAAGGIIGYAKAGSTVSLGAGLLFGGLAGLGAYKSSSTPGDHWLTLGIAISLSGLMGARFYSSGKFMPAGLVALMSVAMVGRCIYSLKNKSVKIIPGKKFMFSSHKRLKARTTPKDLNRPDYLQALVTEFQNTNCQDAKQQVLANLANFAYDPINFPYLRELHVIDLFIDCIEADEDLNGNIVEFGIGGLCNAAADIENRKIINDNSRSIELVIRCLSSSIEDTVLSAITTLMQLVDDSSRSRIITSAVIDCMHRFSNMTNCRFRNLAQIFLCDYCKPEEIASSLNSSQFLHIPLPLSR